MIQQDLERFFYWYATFSSPLLELLFVADLISIRNTIDFDCTTASSVVDMGTCDEHFTTDTEGEEYSDGTIRDWTMEARTEDGSFIFHLVESGRQGQYYFLHERGRQEQAEKWLDDCFNGLLQKYGADKCKSILGGEGHVCLATSKLFFNNSHGHSDGKYVP